MKFQRFSLLAFLLFICLRTGYGQEDSLQLKKGLVAHYSFDQGKGTDLSGNENHATLFGASLENHHCGTPAFFFDGEEDYIDFGNKDNLNLYFKGLTVSVWVNYKPSFLKEFGFIVGKWAFDPLDDQFGMFLSPNKKISFAVGDGQRMAHGVYGDTPLEPDTWYHVLVTWDPDGNIHFYLNGQPDGKGVQPGRGMNEFSTTSLKMGRQVQGKDRPYYGYIDEVRIYNRKLNEAEIEAVYQEGFAICNNMNIIGNVLDADTFEPVEASITFEDLNTGEVVYQTHPDSMSSQFSATVPIGRRYGFYASAPGYISVNENLNTEGFEQGSTATKDLFLKPLKVGQVVRINNLFFDFDKYVIRDESFLELGRLLQLLKDQPGMIVEIAGHTDSDGSDSYNEILSKNRAHAVMEWMLSQGVETSRIKAKGYGEAEPVSTNFTEEGKQQNRRVEFRVIAL